MYFREGGGGWQGWEVGGGGQGWEVGEEGVEKCEGRMYLAAWAQLGHESTLRFQYTYLLP